MTTEATTFLTLALAAYAPQGGALFAFMAEPHRVVSLVYLLMFAIASDSLVTLFALCAISRYDRIEYIGRTWKLWVPIDDLLVSRTDSRGRQIMKWWSHAEEAFIGASETQPMRTDPFSRAFHWLGGWREHVYLAVILAVLAGTSYSMVLQGLRG